MAWAILLLPLLIVVTIAAIIGPKQWAKYQEERRRRAEELSDACRPSFSRSCAAATVPLSRIPTAKPS